MTTDRPLQPGDLASVEVRFFRGGDVVHRQLCESADEAAALVAQWAEDDIDAVEVDDLSARHRGGEVLEPDLEVDAADLDEGYAHD